MVFRDTWRTDPRDHAGFGVTKLYRKAHTGLRRLRIGKILITQRTGQVETRSATRTLAARTERRETQHR
jgi:hypothetical protein